VYTPSLDLLRQVLHPGISNFQIELIKKSFNPSGVYRLALEYSRGQPDSNSVILKYFEPGANPAYWSVDREYSYYQIIYPNVEINKPELYYLGFAEDDKTRVLVLEDLSTRYYIPNHPYFWNKEEFSAILRTYARLHALGANWLPQVHQREWMLQPQETRWDINDIPGMVQVIEQAGIWNHDLDLNQLIAETRTNMGKYADHPITLLHYDTVPPNIGIPNNLQEDAILIDWQDATWGIAELDLAYFFNQPFSSAKNINRQDALDYYWKIRARIEGKLDSPVVRDAIQRYADILLCFTLISAGHRVTLSPYPEGTYPYLHWESMFEILHDRLLELSQSA